MIANLLLLIPGAGPFLAAAWPCYRRRRAARRILTVGMAGAFAGGWSLKARLDRSATLQAVIAKQRIDLQAAHDIAEPAAVTADCALDTDANNQEVIRDLQLRLAQRPSGACALDPAAADSLRRLR